MLISAAELGSTSPFQSSIIVVGAGAVGLMVANDLARRGVRTVLLEAGPKTITKKSQDFFEKARSVGRALEGLHIGRFRALGGTTNFWGGQLVPFEPVVFLDRPWLRGAASWPVTFDELQPYYKKVYEIAGMDGVLQDDAEVMKEFRVSPHTLPKELDFFFTRWMPEPNLARLFEPDLRKNPNLTVVLDAPVVELSFDQGSNLIERARIVRSDGSSLEFSGRAFVLANGTIEIARLLSLPLKSGDQAPWQSSKWLGRGFMDHVDVVAGDVKPIDARKLHNLFDNGFIRGIKYQPKLKLSEEAQRSRGLLGIAAHLIFRSSVTENLANAKTLLRSITRDWRGIGPVEAINTLRGAANVALPLAYRYVRYRRMYNPADLGIQLRLTSEQVPLSESRLTLDGERDKLGMPLAAINWKVDGVELETMATFSEILSKYLEDAGVAKVALDQQLSARDSDFLLRADDANHHMGMARMSDHHGDGVVDRNLRVHGTRNLFVAGAAVYPSTGFANPTLTAMALGLRLSNGLANGLLS
ncbi:GMC family oxidoreductase [Bradyrhizobium sp. NBAIM32]|uniref:GMC oxidoreductase n=1 Tax=Bradyrhizobium sp. NBAIM32 TaxID=2793809 RepID=UPI001CD4B1BD|nr:GMC family oxidoreductase [Bradyrhizobium sp. NBAIM32]MCA1539907.1 GMC family oxidoreductase [Bradyrhizobium sp. NBAIM32]